jgi:Protein of unknown function (DUF1579)
MLGKSTSAFVIGILLALANANGQPPPLQDSFLDNFVGDWRVERNMGKRGVHQNSVHCEWVLNHQFIEFHYGMADPKPEYEAFVFIGFDDTAKNYVCHWVDVFGAKDSELGRGKLDNNLLALELKFGNGELTNKFTFDSQTKTWTSLIRQIEKGEWTTFAEEKWTKK